MTEKAYHVVVDNTRRLSVLFTDEGLVVETFENNEQNGMQMIPWEVLFIETKGEGAGS